MRSVRYGLVFETFEQHKYKHGFVLMSYVSISVILYAVHLCFLFMSGRRTKSTTKESKKKNIKKKIQRKKKSRKKKKLFRAVFEPLRKRTPDQKSSALSIWLWSLRYPGRCRITYLSVSPECTRRSLPCYTNLRKLSTGN